MPAPTRCWPRWLAARPTSASTSSAAQEGGPRVQAAASRSASSPHAGATTRWRSCAASAGRNWPSYDYISVGRTSGNRLLLDQALAGVAGRPQAIYEAQHVTTTLGLVEAGLGVAAVPSMAMPAPDHPLLVSVPLVDPVVTRKVGLIRRRGRSLSPAAQQLYDLFSELKGRGRVRGVA